MLGQMTTPPPSCRRNLHPGRGTAGPEAHAGRWRRRLGGGWRGRSICLTSACWLLGERQQMIYKWNLATGRLSVWLMNDIKDERGHFPRCLNGGICFCVSLWCCFSSRGVESWKHEVKTLKFHRTGDQVIDYLFNSFSSNNIKHLQVWAS